jgi:hypothetical protein
MRSIPGHLTDAELVPRAPGAALRESSSSTPSSSASAPPLFLLTEGADQLIRVSTGAMPARLSPAGPRSSCSIPTIADSDSNRLRTGIPIDRGQHSDDCGQQLPSTASWVHMSRVRVKFAPVGSYFLGTGFPVPRQGPVPVANRRGSRASRSDRHESNAATRVGGPCWPTGAGVMHGSLLIFLLPS